MFRWNRGAWALVAFGMLLAATVPTVTLAADGQSNHAAAFLRAGAGARYFGLGGAGSSTADDAYSVYWNPAGLSLIRGFSVTGMMTGGMTFDRNHNYVGLAYGWDTFALGLGWINASTQDLTATGQDGTFGENFNFSENAILLSGGFSAGPVGLGITGKYLVQDVGTTVIGSGESTANGFGLDLGAVFIVTDYLKFGATVQDLFTNVGGQSQADVDEVPLNVRVGASVMPADGFTLAADIEKTNNQDKALFHIGGEYWVPFSEAFAGALRLGLDDGDFAGGIGLALNWLVFDYAYVVEPQGFMNENHRFSLTLDFGEKRSLYRSSGDKDKDGIPDKDDECPDQAEDFDGYQDTDGCPEFDNDGDGILDVNDECPNQPEDFDGFEDEDGCPDLDNDGDGILDADDNCPGQAETFNGFEDSDGCPDDEPIYFPIANINFKFNTAEISGADPIPVLEEVVRIMKEHPNIRVEIQGHTDNIGSEEYNMRLSERRSEAIEAYLVERGIDGDRTDTRGFGMSRPIDTNDTDLGRARNRRIEFVVVDR